MKPFDSEHKFVSGSEKSRFATKSEGWIHREKIVQLSQK
jgi:hypothetical protein